MHRRRLLQFGAALALARHLWRGATTPAGAATPAAGSRARPGDPAWPSPANWDELARNVGGRLIKPQSPLAACVDAPSDGACARIFKESKNPYDPDGLLFLSTMAAAAKNAAMTDSRDWIESRPDSACGERHILPSHIRLSTMRTGDHWRSGYVALRSKFKEWRRCAGYFSLQFSSERPTHRPRRL
jgi:hypothetical protein